MSEQRSLPTVDSVGVERFLDPDHRVDAGLDARRVRREVLSEEEVRARAEEAWDRRYSDIKASIGTAAVETVQE